MPASRGICEFWRRYLDGIPPYLAQRYWWAYLARPGVWFFDHALIIDAILFGHYAELMQAALTALDPARSTLMIASVYGRLIPELVLKLKQPLVLVDVAPIQLELAARKIARTGKKAYLVRSNAEALGLSTGAFAQALVFFLWHEMPRAARMRSLKEAVRVLGAGGRLVVVDYGALGRRHWLHRLPFTRALLVRLEPFLDDFWRMPLARTLQELFAARFGCAPRVREMPIFGGFYRLLVVEDSSS